MEFFDMLSTMDPTMWDQVARGMEGANAASAAQGATATAMPPAMPQAPTPEAAPPVTPPAPAAPMAPPATGAPPAAPGTMLGNATGTAGATVADKAANPFAMSPDMIKALMAAMGQGGAQQPRMPGGAMAPRGAAPNIRPPISAAAPAMPGARRGF